VSRYAPGTHTPEGRSPVTRYTARARQHDGQMVARLRAGRSMAEAQAQLKVVNSRRLALDPLSETLKTAAYHPWVESLRSAHVSSVKSMVLLVQVGALFLLLLGAINLAGLLLIRASGRLKEMAVRQALGAGRGRLASEILTEPRCCHSWGRGRRPAGCHWPSPGRVAGPRCASTGGGHRL